MTVFNLPFPNPVVQDINHVVTEDFFDTWNFTLETGPQFFVKFNFDSYFLLDLKVSLNDITFNCLPLCASQFVLSIPPGQYHLDIYGKANPAFVGYGMGYNGDFLALPINTVPGPEVGSGLLGFIMLSLLFCRWFHRKWHYVDKYNDTLNLMHCVKCDETWAEMR